MPREFVLAFNLRKIWVLSIFLLCAIFSTSFRERTATSLKIPEETSQPGEIPADWRKIETDDFSFSIPPPVKETDVQGIDSFVMQFENNEITLNIEYGDYSADVVSQSQYYEGQKEQAIIDGKNVVIVTLAYNKPMFSETKMTNTAKPERNKKIEKNYFTGVNFPDSMKSYYEPSISFKIRCKSLKAQEIAKTILYSIEFKQK